MRKLFCCLFAMAMLLSQLSLPAVADVVSPGDDFYYLDEADVLTEATEGEIFFSNQLLDKACGAQIVIVVVDTTGNMAIDDYAYELFNEWGIGDNKEQNGFLLLMAIEDEDYYALAGTGLDFKFSSGTIGSYLDKYLEPYFADGDYDDGARAFFEAAFARISEAYGANVSVEDGIKAYEDYVGNYKVNDYPPETDVHVDREGRKNNSVGISPLLIIFGLVIILVILSSSKNKRQHYGHQNYHTKPEKNSFWLPFILGRMSGNAGSRSTFTPPPNRGFHRTPGNDFHMGGFGGSSSFGSGRPGAGRSGGFSAGRSSGFGSGRSSGFGSGRSRGFSSGRSGFGGARGGGGGTRGGGAGRGRR